VNKGSFIVLHSIYPFSTLFLIIGFLKSSLIEKEKKSDKEVMIKKLSGRQV